MPASDNLRLGLHCRHTGIIVIVSILSVTMSTSAVDSLQNAIVDNISGVYLKNSPLLVVRGLVLLLTVPPMIVSLKVCDGCYSPLERERNSLIASQGFSGPAAVPAARRDCTFCTLAHPAGPLPVRTCQRCTVRCHRATTSSSCS
jgi:hypothetical protein